ncbi:MAG: hypothetical protein ACTHV2_09735 [Brachybacterium sp.]|uniref:hypothetical protein n=1 Tax=Brachybacterium sp. TaxID=1891286 RepID=UPI0026537D03|nr:hypothetical protein [Brachybacterium sp.]MDN6328702.1 hypothetical protein [Brachybacterium sp.]MDN6399016.1 hypothetical protein [Brachybacterium sp.]
MYAWLFRHLPGPLWARIVLTVLVLAAIVVALFAWAFPAIAPLMPFNDGMVGAAAPEELSRRSSGA